jgi:hypothetical protein
VEWRKDPKLVAQIILRYVQPTEAYEWVWHLLPSEGQLIHQMVQVAHYDGELQSQFRVPLLQPRIPKPACVFMGVILQLYFQGLWLTGKEQGGISIIRKVANSQPEDSNSKYHLQYLLYLTRLPPIMTSSGTLLKWGHMWPINSPLKLPAISMFIKLCQLMNLETQPLILIMLLKRLEANNIVMVLILYY